MGGGAWPFLVGGVICLVNSDNERDLNLLNSEYHFWSPFGEAMNWYKFDHFLEGLLTSSQWKFEAITGL